MSPAEVIREELERDHVPEDVAFEALRALLKIAELLNTHRAYCEEHGVDDCDMAVVDKILAEFAAEVRR